MTRKEITQLSQLEGKKVGVLTETGQTSVATRITVEKAGATATYLPLIKFDRIYAALAAGEIDAGALPIDLRFSGQVQHGWNAFPIDAFDTPSIFATTRPRVEDLGNAIHLEHVNVQVPDQRLATLFYVAGLGLTRDPYLMVSDTNMWVNVGRSQFHLPSGEAQVLRGHTGIVIPGREALLDRLASVAGKLDGTAFAFSEHNDYVEATCPWGNRVRCHEPDAARFGRISLGIPYVEFEVPAGTAKGISAFYPEIMGIQAELSNGDGKVARAKMGKDQYLQFRETDRPQPDYDGHHVQMYITNFSGPYRLLSERDLISSEDNQYQYRFRDIIDPAMAGTCSRSSTRCAAPPTRCTCGR